VSHGYGIRCRVTTTHRSRASRGASTECGTGFEAFCPIDRRSGVRRCAGDGAAFAGRAARSLSLSRLLDFRGVPSGPLIDGRAGRRRLWSRSGAAPLSPSRLFDFRGVRLPLIDACAGGARWWSGTRRGGGCAPGVWGFPCRSAAAAHKGRLGAAELTFLKMSLPQCPEGQLPRRGLTRLRKI
jgi:hypothetical protein